MDLLEVALRYARNGIKVFPCNSSKIPAERGGNGYKDATTSEKIITDWWTRMPNSLIGAPNDQFLVIDSDDYDLCYLGKMLHQQALTRLTEEQIITEDAMRVKTVSGGTHYYFKKDNISTRSIKCLPYFDLLSTGGYTILPDQLNYVAINTDVPWDKILDLPKFKVKEFTYLVDEFEEATLAAKRLKVDSGTKLREKKNPSKTITFKKKEPEELPEKTDHELYTPAEKRDNPFVNESLLTNGKLYLKKGELNSELVNRLFYNREIQQKLGKFLGLKQTDDRITQRSVFTHHQDKKPSMGVRWSKEKTYLIVRDFSLFFSKQKESDYDLVRLYTSNMYGRSYKPTKTEFVLWFTRLLHEAGILQVDIKPLPEIKLTKNESKVLGALYTLDAYKSLYDGYSGMTTFSVSFAKAWLGVNIGNALSKIKKSLVEKKLIEIVGDYDCAATYRTDGFYKTELIKLSEGEPMNNNSKLATQQSQENEVEKKYPDLGTVYSLKVSEKSYKILKNFCDDFDIPNTPDRDYMHAPLLVSDSFIADVLEKPETQYLMNDLTLFIVDADDRNMLMCEGKSTAFEELWRMINDKHGKRRDDFIEDPIPAFVLSYDIGDVELDLNALELKLNEYTNPAIMLNDFKTHYINNDQMDDVLDGIAPEI